MSWRGSSVQGTNLNRSSPTFDLERRTIYERYGEISDYIENHTPHRPVAPNGSMVPGGHQLKRSSALMASGRLGATNGASKELPKPHYLPSIWNEQSNQPRWDRSGLTQTTPFEKSILKPLNYTIQRQRLAEPRQEDLFKTRYVNTGMHAKIVNNPIFIDPNAPHKVPVKRDHYQFGKLNSTNPNFVGSDGVRFGSVDTNSMSGQVHS